MKHKDKSQEELDNEKKWDRVRTFILLLILMVGGVYLTGNTYKKGYEQGVASVKPVITYGYSQDLEDGRTCTSTFKKGQLDPCNMTHEVSILAEQKKCEEMGGEFWLDENNHYYPNNTKELDVTITCTSPAKELFKYEIK